MREGDGFLLTPSGWSLRDVTPASVVSVDADGHSTGDLPPSKEAGMHIEILRRRPDLNFVCRVHGVYIVAASAMLDPGGGSLPPLCPGFVHYAYPLPMIEFMGPGSRELAEGSAQHCREPGRLALLLQNHGLIAAGPDWQTAVNVAEEVDEAASIYVLSHGRARGIRPELINRIR